MQDTKLDRQFSSPFIEWFIQHRKTIATSFAIALLAITLVVWWMSHRRRQEIQDFERADVLAEELHANDANLTETLDELQALDDKYASLHRRFDGILAQEFIIQSEAGKIDPYANRAINELHTVGLTPFATFSEVSRLIGKGEHKEALDLAYKLKSELQVLTPDMQLIEGKKQEYTLLACTLLDIVTLNQRLGNYEARDAALKELLAMLGISAPLQNRELQDKADAIKALLQENESTLFDYLKRIQEQS